MNKKLQINCVSINISASEYSKYEEHQACKLVNDTKTSSLYFIRGDFVNPKSVQDKYTN